MAAMTGLVAFSSRSNSRWPFCITVSRTAASAFAPVSMFAASFRSSPATKARCPAPVMTITFTSSSANSSSRLRSSSSSVAMLKALAGGWSIVNRPTRSSIAIFRFTYSAMHTPSGLDAGSKGKGGLEGAAKAALGGFRWMRDDDFCHAFSLYVAAALRGGPRVTSV